jgi:hypothetical protein
LITLLYWDAMEEEGINRFKDTLHGKFLARERELRDAVFWDLEVAIIYRSFQWCWYLFCINTQFGYFPEKR